MTEAEEAELNPVYPMDEGKGIARMDEDLARTLRIAKNDIVRITSKKKMTVAEASDFLPELRGTGRIQLDKTARDNLDEVIGAKVKVEKIEAINANEITFAPADLINISGGEEFLRRVLQNRVITKGNTLKIAFLGREIPFRVISYSPEGMA